MSRLDAERQALLSASDAWSLNGPRNPLGRRGLRLHPSHDHSDWVVMDLGGGRQPPWTEPVARLAGEVAHQVNKALTAIEGNVSDLEEEMQDDRLRRETEGIRAVCSRTADLTSRLLSISGVQRASSQVIDARDLIAEMDLGKLVSGEVSICTDLQVTPCPVLVDRAQLEEVVVCLVSNARDAVLPRGTIREGIDRIPGFRSDGCRSGGWVQLEVSDSGPGMDRATLELALVPFYSTQHERGRGLGLAIVHGFTRQAGGGMSILSHPEAGTSVRIWLPLADHAMSNGGPPRPSKGSRT